MKYIVPILFGSLAIVFLPTDASGVEEKEEIFLKDKNNPVVRSEPQVEKELREAHLERIGFTKSRRTTVEVVDGQRKKRKFIKYSVRDLCTKEKYWRRKMEKRLPKHFFSHSLDKDLDKEVKNSKPVVPQKYCDFGIEIELRPDGHKRFFFFGIFVFVFIG